MKKKGLLKRADDNLSLYSPLFSKPFQKVVSCDESEPCDQTSATSDFHKVQRLVSIMSSPFLRMFCSIHFRRVGLCSLFHESVVIFRNRGSSVPDMLFLKHACSILRQSSNPVCGFSMMKQVKLCAVWSTENWLGSSVNHIQGWMTV